MKSKKLNLKISYIIVICFIMIIIFSLIFPGSKLTSKTVQIEKMRPIGEIQSNDVVEQKFVSDGNYTKFGIFLANYGQIIDQGDLIIEVIDENNKISKKKIKLSTITDNSYFYIDYKLKKNKSYVIRLTVQNENYPITLYTTKAKLEHASLKYNNEQRSDNMILSFVSTKKNYFNIWYCVFGIALICCYITLMKDNKE